MLPRFHISKRVSKRVSKPCFGLWFWGPTALHQMLIRRYCGHPRRPDQLPPAIKLDNILRQLTNLRSVWGRISPSKRIQSLNIASDGLDDLVEQLDTGIALAPGFTKTEKALLGLFAAAFLTGASVLIGVHFGRHSCPALNVARVGP